MKDETLNKIITIDIEKCLACNSCKLSCAVEHSNSKDLFQAIKEEEKPFPRIILEQIGDHVVPIHCRHCEDAPCIIVCPSKAMTRSSEESPVQLDNKRCIGCHACILVCPFGVIKKAPQGKKLSKCDLCLERLEQGKIPACVEACPTGAIQFLTIEEINKKKRVEYLEKYRVALQ